MQGVSTVCSQLPAAVSSQMPTHTVHAACCMLAGEWHVAFLILAAETVTIGRIRHKFRPAGVGSIRPSAGCTAQTMMQVALELSGSQYTDTYRTPDSTSRLQFTAAGGSWAVSSQQCTADCVKCMSLTYDPVMIADLFETITAASGSELWM
jgi:hypothetical protein